jgi:hypothetical protein
MNKNHLMVDKVSSIVELQPEGVKYSYGTEKSLINKKLIS